MTIKTKVSICLPTYKRPDLLIGCIESCLAQTHTNIEIVIGDDSPDEQTERLIAARYGNDERIAYRRNTPALGQARNVDSLFARATGDKILLIHDDDYLAEQCVERLLAQWERHPEIQAAFGNQYEVDHDGSVDYASSQRMNHAYHRTPAAAGLQALPGRTGIVQMFPNNGWLADAALVKQISYDEQHAVCCDYVFGVRLCLAARGVCYIDEHVSYYRKTDVSVSQSTRNTTSASSLAAWSFLQGLTLPPALEPARKLAMRRFVPIVVSLYARNDKARAGLHLALGNLHAYRFGLSPRLYYHLLMIWKSARRAKRQPPALAFDADEAGVEVAPIVDVTPMRDVTPMVDVARTHAP
ncbi:glycosyltransferase family 2 protein [Paraburkholderia silviterrae]|uniref:Glycosyltransferase family 2 protein n=1 Tax=Paraburkholderia silviterrae TaxID=2528715 RepID=A0A4R5MB29_9BURK|nr:glycosyltransferase family 2 protein [Paraburkholderia silviterrae]TDG23354.1 glycosyltransferase family 2 protein [Paraburkholderia silviterrae]